MRTSGDSTAALLCGTLTKVTLVFTALVCLAAAQAAPPTSNAPPPAGASPAVGGRSALDLYRNLGSAELDPNAVYAIREAAIDREDLHITFTEGTIAFTRSIDGRVTGAFFEGDGELLLVPPDQVERGALSLAIKNAVLQDRFTTAYLRFFDDKVLTDLQPRLRPAEAPSEFLARFGGAARNLAVSGALRLLLPFTHSGFHADGATAAGPEPPSFLSIRVSGGRLGTFDVFFDRDIPEEITAGQITYAGGAPRYDLWLSFPARSSRDRPRGSSARAERFIEPVALQSYTIRATVQPPRLLEATSVITATGQRDGDRTLLFELSHHLKIASVTLGDQPLEVIQNEPIPGTDYAQRGNDVVAVVLPQPIRKGQTLELNFTYSGDVLSDAGNGLLYVGARGTWYPRRGMPMSRFDMEFRTPAPWTLLATGTQTNITTEGEFTVTRWVSRDPIPIAGFNLGRYSAETVPSRDVEVTAYAAAGVEEQLRPRHELIRRVGPRGQVIVSAVPRAAPAPAAQMKPVAQTAAAMIDFLSPRIGPFPFDSLALTQMPGPMSQGWPGLIYLSSYVFLRPEERAALPGMNSPALEILYGRVMIAHETAHQWWGDSVSWASYRDQWISEGVSNYLSLMQLERDEPEKARALMAEYREQLLQSENGSQPYRHAGPVTLGSRLTSSRFPNGYETVTYARGTWLLHMLRHMLREGASPTRPRATAADPDAAFFSVLRNIQKKFARQQITTAELVHEFEATMPATLHYNGGRSLDWFLDGWVNGAAIPKFELRNVKFAQRAGKRVATATIVQQDAPAQLVTSLPIYALVGSKQVFAGRVFADGEETDITVTVPAGAAKLLLDPHHAVLRQP